MTDREDVWTYLSALSVTTPGDLTDTYYPGLKTTITQTTVKYFQIETVTYSAETELTTITLNGYGLYTVSNAEITAHSDMVAEAPAGFPLPYEGSGRPGGQTITGGTGSGESLTLQSTSHATKGPILVTPARLSMRPFIELGTIASKSKPTIVYLGANAGYSLPIWNGTTNVDEQLFISEYIAGRWDGASDITLSVIGYLDTAEDVGDDFALQVSWANKSTGSGIFPSATNDVTVETNIDTDRAAQYSVYKVDFSIVWDYPTPDVVASDLFSARIRRVAITAGAGKAEISGEFVVAMIVITYTVNKIFKAA